MTVNHTLDLETASQHLLNLTPIGRWEDWLPARDALIIAAKRAGRDESRQEIERLTKLWHQAVVINNDMLKAKQATERSLTRCEMALEKIARWFGEFPTVVDRDGNQSSYGAAYGSNGERDFMRDIAAAARWPYQDKSSTL